MNKTKLEPPATPECERFSALRERYSQIEEFLEFLGEEKIHLAHYDPRHFQGEILWSYPEPTRQLLMRFFQIDEQKLAAEREALLEYQRALNKAGG